MRAIQSRSLSFVAVKGAAWHHSRNTTGGSMSVDESVARGLRLTPVLAALLALPSVAIAAEQAYPSRPVRIVVPFSPGGAADILARVVGQRMTESWGQQVIIDNRTGAGGIIGA